MCLSPSLAGMEVGANKMGVVEGGREEGRRRGGAIVDGDGGAGIVDAAVCFVIHSHANGTWSN